MQAWVAWPILMAGVATASEAVPPANATQERLIVVLQLARERNTSAGNGSQRLPRRDGSFQIAQNQNRTF